MLTVQLRAGYLARYVRLVSRQAFPSGVAIAAIDDNGAFHNVDCERFETFAAADAFIASQPSRIWAEGSRGAHVVTCRGSARVSLGGAR